MTRRIVATYLLLTVVVLAILEVPYALAIEDRARDDLTSDLVRDAFTLAGLAEDTLERGVGLDLQAVAENYQARTGARLVIVDASGIQVADSDGSASNPRDFSTREEIAAALTGSAASGTRRSETLGGSIVYVAVPVSSGGTVHGALRLTYPTSEVDERVHAAWLGLAAIAAISLAVAAGVGIALARSAARPLARVTAAAGDLGGGALDARAPDDTGPPEVRALARSFNDMAERLARLITAQEQFVADASHQLRTPLTALRLRLDNLEAEATDAGSTDAAAELGAALAEVDRLSRLVDGLLLLARAERTETGSTAVPTELGPVLAERVEVWSPVAGEHGIELVLGAADGEALVTPDHLDQALDNLVANALDASPSGSRVALQVAPEGDLLAVHVTDQGPGLSEEQRARAFDRFWRASATRTDLGGSGLGLSIVQSLLTADGGSIELRPSDPPPGLDAVLLLRRAPAAR